MIKKKLIMIVMEPWKIMDNDDLVEDLANDLMWILEIFFHLFLVEDLVADHRDDVQILEKISR